MAHLLIIDLPGGNDVDIVQAAIERSDEFTFLTSHLALYQQQTLVNVKLAAARELIEISPFDYAAVEQRILALHAHRPIDAVLCLIDIRMTEAARLAERLGVRHLNPASAALLRDKFDVRSRLAEQGLAQPEFMLAQSNQELQQAVKTMGLPVLIKPADGYGSQNIILLRHPEDLDPMLSPLDDLLPCRADYGLGVLANDRWLVERYLSGRFIGCDTLTVDGRHQLLGINEKLFFEPPSFAIFGGCFTPNNPTVEAIERYVFAALDAVGFDCGAAHTELMLTDSGPQLIEINSRLVGAKIARLIGYALDRSIHADLISLHLGETLAPLTTQTPAVAVTRWIVADREGILERVDLPLQPAPGVRCVELLKLPGDRVRRPLQNADRIGYVMTCAASRAEAEQLADDFLAQTRVCLQANTD